MSNTSQRPIVQLYTVWTFPIEQVRKALSDSQKQVMNDDNTDRYHLSVLYYQLDYLFPEDRKIIEDPKYKELVLNKDISLEDKLNIICDKKVLIGIHLRSLAEQYKYMGDNNRAGAFQSAAIKIEGLTTPVKSSADVSKIKGVGSSTISEINELLGNRYRTTQRMVQLKTQSQAMKVANAEKDKVLALFRDVYGIGEVKAKLFYDEGYRTIEQLSKHPKLTDGMKVGIYWYYHFKERITRAEMDYYVGLFKQLLGDEGWMIVGSYRRLEPDSGDIDIIAVNSKFPHPKDIVEKIRHHLVGDLANGPSKYMGAIRISVDHIVRRIDIRTFSPEVWPYALLYNTGSGKFNILMRVRANELGYELSEYSLSPLPLHNHSGPEAQERTDIPPIPRMQTEEDIFAFLGLKYLKPEERLRDLEKLETVPSIHDTFHSKDPKNEGDE